GLARHHQAQPERLALAGLDHQLSRAGEHPYAAARACRSSASRRAVADKVPSAREQTTKRRTAQLSFSGNSTSPAALTSCEMASRGITARPSPTATMRQAASRLDTCNPGCTR